jgi:hypothetical protein
MADASKLKGLRRSGLGAPPPQHEARTDLAPELSRAAPPNTESAIAARQPQRADAAAPQAARMDGRTMRRSGRTVQFATRVSPGFDERIRQIAMRDGLLLVEVLECALEAYEAGRKKTHT